MLKRLVAGFGALILSAVLLVGLPALLVALAGNPIPSWDRLVQALTMPDYGGEFLVGTIIPILAWIAWAWFAVGYVAEVPNQLRAVNQRGTRRGARRVTLPGLALSQKGAGVLIAAILTVFAPAGAFAASADAGPVDATPVTISASTSSAHTASTTDDAAPVVDEASATLYTVTQGDSLWAIAEAHLGDGNRWQEIFDLNKDRAQPDGNTISQRQGIDPGMQLELPSAPATAPAAAVEASSADHVVQPGDTLWGISEKMLGSGDRYMEIFDASTSIIQPGGAQLTDPSEILPGWSLDVTPDTAPAVTPPAPAAEETAPVPETAPVEASAPTAADDQTMRVEQAPVEAALPVAGAPVAEGTSSTVDDAQPGPSVDSEEKNDASQDSGLGYVTSSDADPVEAEAPSAAPVDVDVDGAAAEDVDDTSWLEINGAWAAGMGGILAAGLLTLLGWRRRQQRRNRKIGQRIQMPAEEVSIIEQSIRQAEAPHDMDAVDLALRTLAVWAQDSGSPLPALYALQLSEETISLFLDTPAQLPAPFDPITDDGMAWSITYEKLTPLERVPSSPYPALVTIGRDENDAQLLVDLERLGSLNIQGPAHLEHAVLSAIALELSATPWGESLQVTLVGFGEQLPAAIGQARMRYVEDTATLVRNLRGQAAAVTSALAAEGVSSVEEARTARPDADAWTPEIVILGELPDEDTRAELAALVTQLPRVGVAAISAGHLAGDWNMLLEESVDEDGETIVSAELEIPDSEGASLPLSPQMVTREYLDAVISMFTTANDDQGIEYSAATPEITVDEISTVVVDVEPAIAAAEQTDDATEDAVPDPEPAAAAETEDATEVAGVEVPGVEVPAAASAETEALVDIEKPALDESEDATAAGESAIDTALPADEDDSDVLAPVRDIRIPRMQLLGPVELLNPQGVTPTTETGIKQWNSQVLRVTELIAYLVTHPGATTKAVQEAMWGIGSDVAAGTSSRNRLTNHARRWLGNDALGTPYFPQAHGGTYTLLEALISDWDEWLELVGKEPTEASTANLVRALQLVKGQPFSGVKDRYYAWAVDELKPVMISAIGDAAHELATRSLRSGNIRHARLAAATGRSVEPENEIHWRNSLRAEHLAGDVAGFERVITQLELAGKRIDPLHSEVEPETQELIDEIRGEGRGRGSIAS